MRSLRHDARELRGRPTLRGHVSGDNSSTWNHLKLSIPMLLNLGMSGFAYSGADVAASSALRVRS